MPRIVHTWHGFPFNEFQSWARRRVYIGLERIAAKRTDAFLAIGSETVTTALRLGLTSPERVRLSWPAVDVDAYATAPGSRAQARRRLDLPLGVKVVGSIGRLTFQKGPEIFAKAIARLPDDVFGLWAGGGPMAEELEKLTGKLGIGERMRWLGHRDDIADVLPAFDVMAMASRWEGLPCVLVEAVGAGIPWSRRPSRPTRTWCSPARPACSSRPRTRTGSPRPCRRCWTTRPPPRGWPGAPAPGWASGSRPSISGPSSTRPTAGTPGAHDRDHRGPRARRRRAGARAAQARRAADDRRAGRGIASLPMLMPFGLPPGPGNTGLPDLALIGVTAVAMLWAGTRRLPVRWPFLIPTLLTIIAGGIAAIVNDAGALTLVKDLFVLLWAVSLANLGRDPSLLRVALRAFVAIGTCYALVMITGFVLGLDALSGKQVDGERAMFTFGDANYASNWFICIFFIARATRYPGTAWRRWAVCGILLTAELLTGSNGGLLALIIAILLGHLFRLVREGRAHHAIAVGAFAAFVGGAGVTVVTQVNIQPLLDQASQTSPILRDSIGRTTGESTNSRSTVLATTLQMIEEQTHPWGIGPGQTEKEMLVRQETYVREAHNDYVASVLERGFLGGVALIVLVFVLLLKCVRIARRNALTGEYARLVPRPELFGALIAVFLISGLFYETLHYRHGWAVFGLIAALDLSRSAQGGGLLAPPSRAGRRAAPGPERPPAARTVMRGRGRRPRAMRPCPLPRGPLRNRRNPLVWRAGVRRRSPHCPSRTSRLRPVAIPGAGRSGGACWRSWRGTWRDGSGRSPRSASRRSWSRGSAGRSSSGRSRSSGSCRGCSASCPAPGCPAPRRSSSPAPTTTRAGCGPRWRG